MKYYFNMQKRKIMYHIEFYADCHVELYYTSYSSLSSKRGAGSITYHNGGALLSGGSGPPGRSPLSRQSRRADRTRQAVQTPLPLAALEAGKALRSGQPGQTDASGGPLGTAGPRYARQTVSSCGTNVLLTPANRGDRVGQLISPLTYSG